jgi:hypothetical protein
MTKEMVLREFKDFPLTETEIDKIVVFYRSGADLLGAIIGPRVLSEETPLKLTLNSLKHSVVLMLELRSGKA